MSTSIDDEGIASWNKPANSRRMRSPKQKRGAKNRELDPLVERVISRLEAHMNDPAAPISQPDLATRSGVDQSMISRVLARQRPEVSFYVLARMVRGAGLSIDWCLAEPPKAHNDVLPWPVPVVRK